MIHSEESPLAGSVVTLSQGLEPVKKWNDYSTLDLSGQRFHVYDWWDREYGASWKLAEDNLAKEYMARRLRTSLPTDDDVLYGLVEGWPCLVHITEIEDI